MELVLNAIWLAIVCFVAAAALKHTNRADSPSVNRICLFVGVLCFAALLFPSISITDDLQQVGIASEEVGRYLLKSADYSSAPFSIAFTGIVALLLAAISGAGYLYRRPNFAPSPLAGFRFTTASRPPPALLS